MTQRSVLITGCSSGIGYDAAHTLAQRGWEVFATCRQQVDCDRLTAEGLSSFVLDYADDESVRLGAQRVLEETNGQLLALFNNGAYAIPGAVEDVPRDALRAIFETNFFGQFDLINQVIPAMKQQGRGRIVNCSSVLGIVAMKFRGAYNSTKFAMEGLTDTLRRENLDSPLHISLIEPGPIDTDFRKNCVAPFERWIDWESSRFKREYEELIRPRLYQKEAGRDRFELPASAVTTKLVHALESPKPKARYYVTKPTYIADALRRLMTTAALDRATEKF